MFNSDQLDNWRALRSMPASEKCPECGWYTLKEIHASSEGKCYGCGWDSWASAQPGLDEND